MGWKLVGHPATKRITKALAEQYANMEAAPGDRPLSENRMMVYEKIAKTTGMRPVSWADAYCVQTGATYRVNGKHTSTLCAKLDPLPEMYAVVEHYHCDTLEEVAQLYATYDSRLNSRTTADINKSFAGCVPQLSEVPQRLLNLGASAVWYADRLERYRDMQPQERAEGLLEHFDFVTWAHALLGNRKTSGNHLWRMPVVAAMFATYRRSKQKAEEFWTQVRDETAPLPSDPTRKLARYLLTHGTNDPTGAGRRRFRISDREFFAKALHAWNAWRKGEPTDLRYYPNAEVPEAK